MAKKEVYTSVITAQESKNSLLIFKVSLVGITASGLLDGMKNIWREYMEKLLNVENDWDGEVDCPVVMGHRCLISEEEVAAAIKGLKIGKAAGPTVCGE